MACPLRIQRLRLTNSSDHKRQISLFAYSELVLGGDREDTQMHIITEWDAERQAIFAYNRYNADFGSYVAFAFSSEKVTSYTGNRTEFIGRNQQAANPAALQRKSLSELTGAALDPCAAIHIQIELEPRQQKEIGFTIGYAASVVEARELISKYRTIESVNELYANSIQWWDKKLSTLQVHCPDLSVNIFMNRWLLYQNLSCRLWGRTAFYQSSGAYGFRDQLQDVWLCCMPIRKWRGHKF